jgi:C4-dicarboxylate transporter DctM subunit
LGVNLYIASAVADRNIIYITRAVLPFLLIQIGLLMLYTYWPDLVLFLPNLLYAK